MSEQEKKNPAWTAEQAPSSGTEKAHETGKGSDPKGKAPDPAGQARKKGAVVTYLAVLFAAAFLLLLLAYFMQQRTNEAAIGSLTQSITSIQSLDDLIEENGALREENEALITENEALTADKQTLDRQLQETTEALEETEMQFTALRTLEMLERMAQGGKSERVQATGLLEEYHTGAELLGGESLKFWLDYQSEQDDEHSPAVRYDALLTELGLAEED